MINFYPLFSGSKGNCLLIKSSQANILVDVGVSFKRLKEALISLNLTTEDIDAIFITHEHKDHCSAVPQILKRTNIKVYATAGTIKGLNSPGDNYIEIDNLDAIQIKNLKVTHYPTSHDCIDPCGYIVEGEDKKISISTDLGVMTQEILNKLENSDLVYIESNHDVNMVKVGPYPYSLKMRVLGSTGHLSNADCSKAICHLAQNGVKNFILAHLSSENNMPEIALETTLCELCKNKINVANLNINVATQELTTEAFKL